MKIFAAVVAMCAVLVTPAWAWWPPTPNDPFPNDSGHYQNDASVIVQEQLIDCWLFDIQTWQQPQSHWSYQAAYHCNQIANSREHGRALDDQQKALEAILLAYEREARVWSIAQLDDDHIDRAVRDPAPLAIHLRSGWYSLQTLQLRKANELDLLTVLEALN